MRIILSKTVQLTDRIGEYLPVSETSFDYEGQLELCDRAAQAAAKGNENTASGLTSASTGAAGVERGLLIPTLKNDVNNPTGLTAQQQHESLTAGEAGAGGATSGLEGAVGLAGTRTRNAGAATGLLDRIARSRMQASAKTSEGIADTSNKIALGKQQAAKGELAGLYGTDTGAALKGVGATTDAINAAVNAGKSGWFQNMTDYMKAAGEDAKGAAALGA